MDFDFSDEQTQLREAVHKWVDKAYSFEARRDAVAAGGFSVKAYQAMAELGLSGLYVQDAYGGMNMGPVEGMVVMEELGRGMVLEPLAHTWISTAVLQGYAPADVKAAWLPRLASGEALVVLAHHEKGARYHLNQCQATATQTGDAWQVSGHKSLVPAGDHAQGFLVPALVNGQQAMCLVPRSAATHTQYAYQAQDGSRMSELHLNQAPAELISMDGLAALQLAVDIGATALCAEAVGLMAHTLAITVEYMNTRQQFGVAIASFQALRHRVADMKMQLELGRSMSYYASLKLNAPAAER
ncbi:MAG: acyl-CoA dehydrogenase, partial [Betaproteobacteria bacterium]|nr:acyl-CoA dehydrogenase [Betaproteobacteria bacterium]